MFTTWADERKYLDLIHPGSGIMHVYDTLPMGPRNFPGTFGSFGAAFLRQICESSRLFQGSPQDNSFHSSFQNSSSHPNYGTGRVLIGEDDLPAILLWLHADDILIRAPTQQNLATVLGFILDMTVILGLICQLEKMLPPTQRLKFCCFIYDTRSTPSLPIPEGKVSRTVTMIGFLTHSFKSQFSRLVVSMVVGFFQSLVHGYPRKYWYSISSANI